MRDYHRDPPGRWRGPGPAGAPPVGAGGAGPGGRRRRRPCRVAAGAAIAAIAAAAIWAGAAAAGLGASGWVDRAAGSRLARYFRLADVAVEGNLHLTREDVLAALGLPEGASLLGLDLRRLAERLAANPWVLEAVLQRRLPDRLVVRVVERAPAAVLLADAGFLVSGDGVLLGPADEEARGQLPVLRAPAGRRYAVGERVALQELAEALDAWRRVRLEPALGGRRPQEVALVADGTYRVLLAAGGPALRLRPEGLEQQLGRLGTVVALRGGGLDDLEEVDLRFPQKVILRPRRAEARPPAARAAGPGGASAGERAPARHPPDRGMDVAPDLRLVPRGGEASG